MVEVTKNNMNVWIFWKENYW